MTALMVAVALAALVAAVAFNYDNHDDYRF